MDIEEEKVRGYVKYIFHPKTGLDKTKNLQFAGFTIVNEQTKKQVKCHGNVPYLEVGDFFEFRGFFEQDKSFKVTNAMRVDDTQDAALSMLKHLFGPKTAFKIVLHFKEDALKALEMFKYREPDFRNEMAKLKGVGFKSIDKAYVKFEKHISIDVLFNNFRTYGLHFNRAIKVFNEFGDKALERIEKNPYCLTHIGIEFEIADKISQEHYKNSVYDSRRIEAGVYKAMRDIKSMGHSYAYLKKSMNKTPTLLDLTSKFLNIEKNEIIDTIMNLVNTGKLVKVKNGIFDIIYYPEIYKSEIDIANKVSNLIKPSNMDINFINECINNYENDKKFKLADKQKEAIINSTKNKFSIITGPPGSGKTTIIDVICKCYQRQNPKCEIKLAAPTGKAAKRIEESTGKPATTVHRLLKYDPVEEQFTFNDKNPLKCDLLIIDEFSMMDVTLTSKLINAIPQNSAVIFVGDKDQLPSVDAGKVLEDMLNSPKIPKTMLNEIYRQKKGSTLLFKALEICNEKTPELYEEPDFLFYQSEGVKDTQETVLQVFREFKSKYGIDNISILTPQNKGDIGVDTLNYLIQCEINPHYDDRPEIKCGYKIFRKGDRVIQLVNEDAECVYNGMVGTIIDIFAGDEETKPYLTVDYGDVESTYERDRLDNIKLAYAITIHKSQGSEYKGVIMITDNDHKFMLRKKLLYTGWTRAKEKLVIVGQSDMVEYAVKNKTEPIRNSRLGALLK